MLRQSSLSPLPELSSASFAPSAWSHALEGCPLQRLRSFCAYECSATSDGSIQCKKSVEDSEEEECSGAAVALSVGPAEPKIIAFQDPGDLDHMACNLTLANYLLRRRRELVVNHRVLQLGCGSGLAGIAASRAGACTVHLTDASAEALDCVRRSAEASGVSEKVVVSRHVVGEPVRDKFDVCLALDVSLETTAIESLVGTLSSVLTSNKATAVVAWRRRDCITDRRVFDELRSHFDISVMADLPCLPHDALKPIRGTGCKLASASTLVFLRLDQKCPGGQKRTCCCDDEDLSSSSRTRDEGRPILRRHVTH